MKALTMPSFSKLVSKVPGISLVPDRGLPNGKDVPKVDSKRRKAALRNFHATVQQCVPSVLESAMQKTSRNGVKPKSKRAKKRRKSK